MCLVPLTVLLLELTWVHENLSNLTTAPSKELSNLPSEVPANQISRGFSKRSPTIANFDLGKSTSSGLLRKRYNFDKGSGIGKSTFDGKRRNIEHMVKPVDNHDQP